MMSMPGPDILFKCPNCGKELVCGSLLSGNTFDTEWFSDGLVAMPMLPEFPSIVKCKGCKAFYWLDKKNKVGECWFLAEKEQYDRAKFLSIDEYQEAIDSEIYTNAEEHLFFRTRLWWAFNDRVREGKELFLSDGDEKAYELNCLKLIELLNNEYLYKGIMTAELFRNIGKFTESIEIIRRARASARTKEKMLDECLKKNRNVVKICNWRPAPAKELRPDTRWYVDAVAADPEATIFAISTAAELAGLAAIVNGTWEGHPRRNNFAGKTIVLNADIDLSQYYDWEPIGTVGKRKKVFSGTFDGNGHVISKLTIDSPGRDFLGLFGYIHHGMVNNLGLADVLINGSDYIGGVTGWIYGGSVANCYSTGSISGSNQVGGIAGEVICSRVTNCYSAAAVNVFQSCGGGLAGRLREKSNVTGCAALNPEVIGYDKNAGRVAGHVAILSNNFASAEMMNNANEAAWANKGAAAKDGEDISIAEINADGTINGLFADTTVWTTQAGRLPGLFGRTVVMPTHLQRQNRGGESNSEINTV